MTQKSQAEPSMDDILASIRRIIAEDPVREAPPVLPVADAAPSLLSARLNDVFGAAPGANGRPNGLGAPHAQPSQMPTLAVRDPFEDDLGGLVVPMAKPGLVPLAPRPPPTVIATGPAVPQPGPVPPALAFAATQTAAARSIPASAQPIATMPATAAMPASGLGLTAPEMSSPVMPAPVMPAPVVIASMPNAPPVARAFDLSSLAPANRLSGGEASPRPEPTLRMDLGKPPAASPSGAPLTGAADGASTLPPILSVGSIAPPASEVIEAQPVLASLRAVGPVESASKASDGSSGMPAASAKQADGLAEGPSRGAAAGAVVGTTGLPSLAAISPAESQGAATVAAAVAHSVPSAEVPVAAGGPRTATPVKAEASAPVAEMAIAAPAAARPREGNGNPPGAATAQTPSSAQTVAPAAASVSAPEATKAAAPTTVAQPASVGPDTPKPAAAKPEAAQTEATMAASQPDPAKPAGATPDVAKPNVVTLNGAQAISAAVGVKPAALAAPVGSPGANPPVPSTALVVTERGASPVNVDGMSDAFEETAAELLRPMLRQWLDSNMPRIVEKALRRELAENPPMAARSDRDDDKAD